jgi:anti-anti-sigma factor
MNFIESENLLVCVLPRKLDTSNSQMLEGELYSRIESAKAKIVFDFKDVDFVSSNFLRICLATYKKVGKANFEIVNVRSEVKKVFMIAGFDKILI